MLAPPEKPPRRPRAPWLTYSWILTLSTFAMLAVVECVHYALGGETLSHAYPVVCAVEGVFLGFIMRHLYDVG